MNFPCLTYPLAANGEFCGNLLCQPWMDWQAWQVPWDQVPEPIQRVARRVYCQTTLAALAISQEKTPQCG